MISPKKNTLKKKKNLFKIQRKIQDIKIRNKNVRY